MAASSTPYPVHEASGSTQSASRTWTNPTRMMKTLELGNVPLEQDLVQRRNEREHDRAAEGVQYPDHRGGLARPEAELRKGLLKARCRRCAPG